ncbi:MAG: NAD(P)/FAD-dependent oxidoreductase [Methanomassiliicoccales archaeon]|nr:NAD(P)/FAD-dependent oxidoreductase [Methanomassiliicoccales archaeon]
MRCDVLVIGGGPTGCMAASVLSPALSTVVLEEHPCIGEPVQCAGLVTPRVVEMVSAQGTVLNRIEGACVHFPGGRTLVLDGEGTKAVVVDRGEFDRHCAVLAKKAGAELWTGCRGLSVGRRDGEFQTRLSEGSVGSRAILVADGHRSRMAKAMGMGMPSEMVRGIEVDLRLRAEDQRRVRVFLGRNVAPGFFAWAIPCGDLTRVGLCVSPGHGTPYRFLEALLEREGWQEAERARVYSGAIPIGHLPRTYADGLLLAGDAAGMAKPLSGGGLFTGMTAGRLAGEVLGKAFQRNDLSARSLSAYQERWEGVFGRELRDSLRVRQAFVRMEDKDLDRMGGRLDRESVRKVLSTGDIDFPTTLAPALLKAAPALLAVSPALLLRLMRG